MGLSPGGLEGRRLLQAAIDPLDGVSFVLGDDALLNVGVHLLVHELLQLGQVVVWSNRAQQRVDE